MWRYLFAFLCLLTACAAPENKTTAVPENALFQRLPVSTTGISFENTLTISEDFDVFRYRNFYNGGGVALADFNNDGLADVFLTSNMGDNKLFLNKGNWKFEDITTKAGVKGTKAWSTGVSIADVNSDGLLDIYVCNAGDINGANRENELFINKGDLTFSEQSEAYGLADRGFSTHAAFFDFDKDGDLDCYVLNNSYRPVSSLGYRNLRHVRDEFGGHKLYRNDNGHFTDISEQAGIFGSVIGFGLGVTVGDVNQDNWPDLYISNDFYERDYLYINNKKGGFTESLEKYMGHISMFSMGADLADLTNDGYPEIFSTDMLPEDDYRLKTLSSFETYDVYQLRLKNDYYHQFMRNMLHLNNRNGSFSEIGQMAQVDATDWSWGALIADFDNDLYKEIFVCNGIYKDVTNQDFVEFLGSSEQMRAAIEGKKIDFRDFVNRMPSVKLSNHMFKKGERWNYSNVSAAWGLAEPSFSNGAAYGDLDNDGDLDLIVNNVNQELFVYSNQSREKNGNHYLALTFRGEGKNYFGLGANVKAYVADQIVAADNMPIRGFQSSMDYKMIIGLGKQNIIDSLQVTWPDGKTEMRKGVKTDQLITLSYTNAVIPTTTRTITPSTWISEMKDSTIRHKENEYNDFDRDRLLYHMLSTQGPALAVADVNKDGADDFYLGGSVGNPGKLFLQRSGKFFESASDVFTTDTRADDTDAAFFDADSDGDLDLYVVSGGSENLAQSLPLLDRFYENLGVKNGAPFLKRKMEHDYPPFTRVEVVSDLPMWIKMETSTSLLERVDFPHTMDCLPISFCSSMMEVVTSQMPLYRSLPQLRKLGMVTDAVWFDFDGNEFPDLALVGEWMPVTVFSNDGKQLKKVENIPGLQNSEGLWNRIKAADLDQDGDTDFVLGNLGLNSRLRASVENPLLLKVNDFDQNGSVEPIFAFRKNGKEYPLALRQDIVKQMSSLKKKFIYYKDYADKSLADLFEPRLLERAENLAIYQTHTSVLINKGNKSFELKPLPEEAQVAPVYGIAIEDLNGDAIPDIILGGNLFAIKPEIGRYDALRGLVLQGDGKGSFKAISPQLSGINITGEVRHIGMIKTKNKKMLAFVRNNDAIKFYTIRK
jgi:hypothetical protein